MSSAMQPEQYPPDRGAEVAIIGRSNSGKSSTLNALCARRKLARTSKTPGCTRMLNFFEVTEDRRIVDLPGYGYARVAASEQQRWEAAISRYFAYRNSLQGVVIVMDARRPLMQNEQRLIRWLGNTVFHVLLNKTDKLKRAEAVQRHKEISEALTGYRATVQLFSAQKGQGVEQLRAKIWQWLRD